MTTKYGVILASSFLATGVIVALLIFVNMHGLRDFFDPVIPDRKIERVEPHFVNGTAVVKLSKDQAS